jgi:hypothetical protein
MLRPSHTPLFDHWWCSVKAADYEGLHFVFLLMLLVVVGLVHLTWLKQTAACDFNDFCAKFISSNLIFRRIQWTSTAFPLITSGRCKARSISRPITLIEFFSHCTPLAECHMTRRLGSFVCVVTACYIASSAPWRESTNSVFNTLY